MRLRVALGGLLMVGAGVAVAACAGFSSEDTQVNDAGNVALGNDSASDAGNDSAVTERSFGAPTEVLAINIPSPVTARYSGKDHKFYYSVAPYFVPTIFTVLEDGGRVPISGPDGGGVLGDAPSFTSIDFMYYAGPAEDGGANTLKFRVNLGGSTTWSAASDVTSLNAVHNPYVLPNGSALYFATPSGIVRATLNVFTLTSEKLVSFKLRDSSVAFSRVSAPVVTPDETAIYFAVPDKSEVGVAHIWTARRGGDTPADAIFVDAHPLEIEGSSGSEVPSWVSENDDELLFSRAPGLNGAPVSVLSIKR